MPLASHSFKKKNPLTPLQRWNKPPMQITAGGCNYSARRLARFLLADVDIFFKSVRAGELKESTFFLLLAGGGPKQSKIFLFPDGRRHLK